MEPKEIGQIISNGRAGMGFTLEEIAIKAKTTKQNIKRYESGNFTRPDHELLNKIFEILKLDKSVLSFHNGTPTEATSETDLAAKWKRLADHYKKLADKYAEIIAERGISLD
jgi:transcriptional regulator with XRE-family HTH domain